MKQKLLSSFATLFLLVWLSLLVGHDLGAKQGDTSGFGYPKVALNNVALNGAAGTRTFTVSDLPGYGKIHFWLYFDYTAQAGIISLTCTGGPNSSDTGYTLTVCDRASTEGECTAKAAGILKSAGSLSADTKWDAELGISGVGYLSCVAAHSGTPGATDKIKVTYILVEK